MRISVVMPAYNASQLIGRALDSVLAQTLSPHEILVVDDGSADDTPAVVAAYGARVKLLHQTNSGPAAARNKATLAATGDWIAFLDSDDAWHPTKLERQVAAVAGVPDVDLVSTSTFFVYADGERQFRATPQTGGLWPGLRYANRLITSSVLVKRDAMLRAGGFDPRLRGCEDWDLWVRVARHGGFVGVQEALVEYHVVPASLSTDYECKLRDVDVILPTLLDGLSGIDRQLCTRRIRSAQLYGAAITAREVGRSPLKLLLRSIGQWPVPSVMPERYLALLQAVLTDRYYGRLSSTWKRYAPGRGASTSAA